MSWNFLSFCLSSVLLCWIICLHLIFLKTEIVRLELLSLPSFPSQTLWSLVSKNSHLHISSFNHNNYTSLNSLPLIFQTLLLHPLSFLLLKIWVTTLSCTFKFGHHLPYTNQTKNYHILAFQIRALIFFSILHLVNPFLIMTHSLSKYVRTLSILCESTKHNGQNTCLVIFTSYNIIMRKLKQWRMRQSIEE